MSRSAVPSAHTNHRRTRQEVSNSYLQQHHPSSSHHKHRQQSSYHSRQHSPYSRSSDEESIASDTVYASRYTSSFTKEDVLVAKIFHLRQTLTKGCLFQRKLTVRERDPDDIGRGRTRYREWEH